jgi:hypothetical protein
MTGTIHSKLGDFMTKAQWYELLMSGLSILRSMVRKNQLRLNVAQVNLSLERLYEENYFAT